MLTLLAKYALDHRLVVEPGFAPKTVKWAINFDSGGKYLGVVELGEADDKKNPGRQFDRCPDLPINVVAGGGGRSHFLVETTQVLAHLYQNPDSEGKERNKTERKRNFFLGMLQDAGADMPELAIAAGTLKDTETTDRICADLESHKAKASDKATLCIDGSFPVDQDTWHGWWRRFRSSLCGATEGATAPLMRCFVTGKMVEPMPSHLTISGLASVGGNPIGDRLVCFDKDAFKSYGLDSSQNCAVSEDAVSAYRAALNDIIAKHSEQLAGAKVAHWFSHETALEDDPLSWITNASDEQQELSAQQRAASLLASIRTGERVDLANNRYYALTLSGAGGRVMIRDWMEGNFEELVESIDAWFSDLQIVAIDGVNLARSPKFISVVGSTVRVLDDLTNPFVAAMWRAAVRRESIPASALAAALARAKIDIIKDESMRPARMGLLKAFHIRKSGGGCELSEYLNEDHTSSAYQCGRLMAMLARVQYAALGDVGANVVQRFYAAASATPALVLGRLARQSQFHIGKVRGEKPGLANFLESKIAEIWAKLGDGLPKSLSLEEQSLFALGYYQQIASDNAGRKKNTADSDPTDNTTKGEANV